MLEMIVPTVRLNNSTNYLITLLQTELGELKRNLDGLSKSISQLTRERQTLLQRYNEIETKLTESKIKDVTTSSDTESPYDTDEGFPWSTELNRVRSVIFKISAFRALQLRAINATMDGKDVLLVMPTGAGKSLVYQLPALLDSSGFPAANRPAQNQITLIISPLVSLMHDQAMGFTRLGISPGTVRVFDASTSQSEQKAILDSLAGKASGASTQTDAPLRLLYITPEKLAKSKRLMNRLEATHAQGRLARIAIDEVHCVSQWGHDFRPDYQFLHVLRRQFPTVPLLGLTATASGSVVVDIQTMLGLQPDLCVVIRAGYNRANLDYQVHMVNGNVKNSLDEVCQIIRTRFEGMSGIIYCFSQKDTEDVARALCERQIRAAHYHASMEPADRSRAHVAWFQGRIAVIVATVAFGMGIDKPDVRFVLHLSASKSMENYYQESGRAGRDSKPADCLLIWRFADLFRLASMVSAERTGLEKLLRMVAYCLDPVTCRRCLIAQHLDDQTWSLSDCEGKCDNCRRGEPSESTKTRLSMDDLIGHIQHVLEEHMERKQERITGPKLVDLLFSNRGKVLQCATQLLKPISSRPNRAFFEHTVAWCIIQRMLKLEFHFTPYSTVCYVVSGKQTNGNKPLCMNYCPMLENSERDACEEPTRPKSKKLRTSVRETLIVSDSD